MKKAAIISMFIFALTPAVAFSFSVYVGVDSTLDFSKLDGFQFDVVGVSVNSLTLTGYASSSTVDSGGINKPGAIPNLSLWALDKVTTPVDGISGYDLTFGSFPLTPGIILSLTAADTFSLSNFILSDFTQSDGKYPLPFTIIERQFADGKEYTYSAVPIPAAVWLLGSGMVGLVVLKRRKKA